MNAKDLALAKINAGPKMFGMYAYGISLGMDIRQLSKIINTPQGRAISKLCEGNVVNGQQGAFSALKGIDKLEGKGIYNDLTQFDVRAISHSDQENGEEAFGYVSVGGKGVKNAYELVETLFTQYYTNVILNDRYKYKLSLLNYPNTKYNGALNTSPRLPNMLYQISILGKTSDCISYITSANNQLWQQMNSGLTKIKNNVEWRASVYQLLEHCLKYGDLVNTYYKRDSKHNYAKDLHILAQGAEEMRILGSILSSNKGVKSKTEEGLAFIKNIEDAIIDRKKLMGKRVTDADKLDFILFCTDPEYRDAAILKYEEVKHTVNILDVVSRTPHIYSYLRANAIPIKALSEGSLKFRIRNKYYDQIVNDLNVTKSNERENVARGIENAVNYRTLQYWMANEDLKFFLPKGNTLFTVNGGSVKTTEDLYIPLYDAEGRGLATFKHYMEQTIIPNLKSKAEYARNSFVLNLIPFELTKTGTHVAALAYTLQGNLLPRTDAELMEMQSYLQDFNAMFGFDFPGANPAQLNRPDVTSTIPSYADAFYIYSQYVFGGKRGPRSLVALFGDTECTFAKKFQQFEALLDSGEYDVKFNFGNNELLRWCAPNASAYNKTLNFFYATSKNNFGRQYYIRTRTDEGEFVNAQKGYGVFEKQYLLNPAIGLNSELESILEEKINDPNPLRTQYRDIELDPEFKINVIRDTNTGNFTVEGLGILNDRATKILNKVNELIQSIQEPLFDIKLGKATYGIRLTRLDALILEAINEVDENC